MTPAELARLRADLAEARQRREALQYRHAVATHTSSSTDEPADLDVELARVEATMAELEERLGAAPAPSPAAPPAVDLAARLANDASAPEYVGTREAAAILGISPRTLEGLRARGEGPPCIRVGRAVRYRREDLRRSAK